MIRAWVLVFLFHGQPMASGLHDLEACLLMAQEQKQAHCWNPNTQERKRP